jgi:hypothetical protein
MADLVIQGQGVFVIASGAIEAWYWMAENIPEAIDGQAEISQSERMLEIANRAVRDGLTVTINGFEYSDTKA